MLTPLICNFQNRPSHRDRMQTRFPGAGGGRMGSDCLMGVEFPFEVMRMFWSRIVVMIAQHCECTKHH